MKKLLFVFVGLLCSVGIFAQTNFQELSLEKACEQARAENKAIFLDCYTSWCGPCKIMANNVFTLEAAGDYFNKNFVCVKVDMEKGEGIELAKRFNVKSFPTFFIIRPDGSIQHKIGGAGSLKAFLGWVEKGLHEETSLDFLNKQYEKGGMNKKQMLEYHRVLLCAGERENAKVILDKLRSQLNDDDRVKADYWFLLEGQPHGSEGFNFVITNYAKLKKNIGEEKLSDYLSENYNKVLNNVFKEEGNNDVKAIKNLLDQVSKEWSLIGWKPDTRLQNKLNLLKACVSRNAEQIISCIEFGLDKQKVSKWNFDLWMMLSALEFVDLEGGKVDKARILAIETRIQGYFANSASMQNRLAPYFKRFK